MPEGAHAKHEAARDSARDAKEQIKEAGRDRDANRDAHRDAKGGRTRDPIDRDAGRMAGDGVGRVGAAFVMPSMEIGLSVLEDWREFAQAGAEHIEDNIRLLENGWRDMSACESAVDLSKVAGRLSYAMSKLMADASQRMAGLASEAASRRLRANAQWGQQVIRQARPEQTH